MAPLTLEAIQHDQVVQSVARVLILANEAAVAQGIDPAACLVTINEEPSAEHVWRIHYGPRDYISRRGGDLIVLVDERSGTVQGVLWGQ